MKRIVVLGGGSAGWLTSLLTREFYPEFDITLIESSEIGILGAGEGTVPHFVEMLDFLRIPVSALVRECNATIKIGIKFTNWHGDGTSFFHDFIAKDELEEWAFDDAYRHNKLTSYLIGKGIHLDSINFYAKLSDQWKVPFLLNDLNDPLLSNYPDSIAAVQSLGGFALHFDARLLAQFLSSVAQSKRRIQRIDGEFVNAVTDQNGYITAVQLKNGQQIECDFVFDCSGFARVLLGKHFKEKWIDCKRHLPMDTALPFFVPHDGVNFAPCTEAIAMKYGWLWKIPVQNRYGCGYVFDSSYIDLDEAKREVEAFFGYEIESPKTFRFEAGYFENTLVKNCYGVGLSQHFFEPLEATAIWTFSKNLVNFLKSDMITHLNPEFTGVFNRHCREIIEPIAEFLHLHYLTERNDSPFWKELRSKTEMMDTLAEKKRLWDTIPLFDPDTVLLQMFNAPSWISVGDGLRFFNRETFKRLTGLWNEQLLDQQRDFLRSKHDHLSKACMLHGDFLRFMQQKSQPIQ